MVSCFVSAVRPSGRFWTVASGREGREMDPCKIWVEQCDAARRIEDDFGVRNALDDLVGEKFLNSLEAAETHPDFRAEIPSFVAEVKTIFEPWQLAEYLEAARQSEPFDPGIYDEDEDPEAAEGERHEDIRRSARDLLLVEQAKGGCWGMTENNRAVPSRAATRELSGRAASRMLHP